MRWNPLAERSSCFIAAWRSPVAFSSIPQKFQTSAGPISALQVKEVPPKRRLWIPRAASTLLRTSAEDPPSSSPHQLFVFDGRYLDEHVDPVQEGAADALLVSGHQARRADALAGWVVQVPAWASLRCHFAM